MYICWIRFIFGERKWVRDKLYNGMWMRTSVLCEFFCCLSAVCLLCFSRVKWWYILFYSFRGFSLNADFSVFTLPLPEYERFSHLLPRIHHSLVVSKYHDFLLLIRTACAHTQSRTHTQNDAYKTRTWEEKREYFMSLRRFHIAVHFEQREST